MLNNLTSNTKQIAPGFLISGCIALAAQFISEHYGAPAMLMALLFGISMNFLNEEGRAIPGISFTSKTVLRVGVALLGARISADLISTLGANYIALVVFSVVATIGFGLIIGRLFEYKWPFSFLTAGSVAICGASAALAIAAILPPSDDEQQPLVFTVVVVTILSTIAMIIYPIIADALQLDVRQSGIFLGGTIHDVAQVVGAGYSVSTETGDVATLVKLIRVTMLAPIVVIASLIIRSLARSSSSKTSSKPTLIPNFVIVFLILIVLNSTSLLPAMLIDVANGTSRWALLAAIGAVGMSTSIQKILTVGKVAISLIVLETLFLGMLVLAGLFVLS